MNIVRWNYRTAFIRCALLLAAGITLQFMAGSIDSGFLRYPWGLVLAVNYAYLIVLAYSLSGRYKWLRTLWDWKACLSSATSLLFMVIVFGLVRQDGAEDGLAGSLGLSSMRSSYAFCIMLFYFMTALGIRSVAELDRLFRMIRSRRSSSGAWDWFSFIRKSAVAVFHICVFLVLLSGMFGSGDKVRCRLTAHEGVPVGMAVDMEGTDIGLPFILVLKEFSIDEYPPKLFVCDRYGGPLSREFLSAGTDGSAAHIDGWAISADTVLLSAGKMPDAAVYRSLDHVGAMPAVFVRATEMSTGEQRSGWVSCGSHIFPSQSLQLDEGKSIVMPYPEARRYLSEVTVSMKNGNEKSYSIEVNHPARIGSWRIYQSGYDTERGRWSDVSILECVRDPWYRVIHMALWLMLAAAVILAVAAGAARLSGNAGKSGSAQTDTYKEEDL